MQSDRFVISPVGPLRLVATREALVALSFVPRIEHEDRTPHEILDRVERELDEYFAGRRKTFGFALAPEGTPFQRSVWKALEAIPFGERRSYKDVARAVGKPHASRAVGAANGRNPIAIVVPCHRVIGASGDLVGYGGGMDR